MYWMAPPTLMRRLVDLAEVESAYLSTRPATDGGYRRRTSWGIAGTRTTGTLGRRWFSRLWSRAVKAQRAWSVDFTESSC
jgi:hypothetical protein